MTELQRKQFGGRVRALRLSREMTQEMLAEAAHLHVTHISLIERGKRNVTLNTILALTEALWVSPCELLRD